ncbi:MAG: hypothetical protein FJ272_14380, partial [Planctomycetes bacterium]|nr:hypothetical protein [Planctomycetota bacterium]
MYRISPPVSYVFDDALADERSKRRVEQMLGALGSSLDSASRVAEADIPEMIRRHGWEAARARQGTLGGHTDPALVFRTLRMDGAPDAKAVLAACPKGTPASLVADLLGRGGMNIHREPAK